MTSLGESRGFYRGKLPDEVTLVQIQQARAVLDAAPVPTEAAHTMARQMGFTGNTCSNCGGVHMQMAGHCEVCSDCGTTTGCS